MNIILIFGCTEEGPFLKKYITFTIFVFMLILSILFTGCKSKDYSNYKNQIGYKEYINIEKSNKSVPYFGFYIDIENNNLRQYLENNMRRCCDYLITNYLDGICINRYVGSDNVINIPETLEGKPVIMLGEFVAETDEDGDSLCAGAFGGIDYCRLSISKNVKYIAYHVFYDHYFNECDFDAEYGNLYASIEIDRDNPYYVSEEKCIYSKDKKTVLYYNPYENFSIGKDLIIPDTVEYFEPLNPLVDDDYKIIFGKNIKRIEACVELGDDGVTPHKIEEGFGGEKYFEPIVKVECYKGTVAEKWAKKHNLKYSYIDK